MSSCSPASHIWKGTTAARETVYRSLESYFGRHLLCIRAPTCGYGPALERNGDIYSCDHFVEPRYKLGNIRGGHNLELNLIAIATTF